MIDEIAAELFGLMNARPLGRRPAAEWGEAPRADVMQQLLLTEEITRPVLDRALEQWIDGEREPVGLDADEEFFLYLRLRHAWLFVAMLVVADRNGSPALPQVHREHREDLLRWLLIEVWPGVAASVCVLPVGLLSD